MIKLFQVLSIKHNHGSLVLHDKSFRDVSLRMLSLRYCDMKHPPTLAYIKHSIRILNLSYNAITFLSDQYFDGCVAMEQLTLSYNRLAVLPNLHGLSRTIRTISLGTNNITDGKRLYEAYFPQLRTVTIKLNSIRTFCMPPRKMWPRMIGLSLAQNNIRSFYLPPWGDVWVNLRGNPIHCDSAMSWVRRCDMVPPGYNILHCSRDDCLIDLTCHSPDRFAGRSPIHTGEYFASF